MLKIRGCKTMKTLVLYASKTGVTEDCAIHISKNLEHTEIQNVKKDKKNQLKDFDRIMIGSPIYIGGPLKAISSYVLAHKDELMKKELFLFTCGAESEKEPRFYLEKAFSSQICNHAKDMLYFGTELRFEKMGFFGRFIMKKIAQDNHLNPTINYEKINQLVSRLKE
jgi:menaquinone-dependent protoporphyrinogen oxidase